MHAETLRPAVAYANDYQTYVERDVRHLIHLEVDLLAAEGRVLHAAEIKSAATFPWTC